MENITFQSFIEVDGINYEKVVRYNESLFNAYAESEDSNIIAEFIQFNGAAIEKILSHVENYERLSTDREDIRSEVILACIEKFETDSCYDEYFFKNVEGIIKDRLCVNASCAPKMSRSTKMRYLREEKEIPSQAPMEEAYYRLSKEKAYPKKATFVDVMFETINYDIDWTRAKKCLTKREVLMLVMIYAEKTSARKVSEQLGLSVRQVRYTANKALMKCQQQLGI